MKRGNVEMDKCWLQYKSKPGSKAPAFLSTIVVQETSVLIASAVEELVNGLRSLYGVVPEVLPDKMETPHLFLTTIQNPSFPHVLDKGAIERELNEEGYLIKTLIHDGQEQLFVVSKTDKGLLYGVFHLLRELQMGTESPFDIVENPKVQLRMINHWDNMDGSIERGYAGASIFYRDHQFIENNDRIKEYARLMASVGINGISINNVNVFKTETKLITDEFLPEVANVADTFRAYGIKTFLSVNFASPMVIGGLNTADPLDEEVGKWWGTKAEEIYQRIEDFGGFIVKADSENRPGPFTYNRTHADGANMLAKALEPFGGVVIWRCFVYNCHQDWRDRTTDRARAAYDHFKPLDGEFLDNVILQIKNGPMDFQVREPVSPLFGAMPKTNQILEFQITQEYTGQQKHLCYLVPQWKEVLDFDTYAKGEGSAVKHVVDGSLYPYTYSGISAVTNIGDDANWTGHKLAQANLYGYGRLIWNPDLTEEQISNEWTIQTLGDDVDVLEQVTRMLADSREIYENYTAPLSVGWMVNINHHFGPSVDGYEYSVWGTYHFADHKGIGVNRTLSSGTGFTGQYGKENTEIFDSLESCPDELLLFFHHVPYTHTLKSGKTVIQHIYDTHFKGVEQAEELKYRWSQLANKIEEKSYQEVLERLDFQVEHSKEWRDIINTYFYRKSGIDDVHKRTIY